MIGDDPLNDFGPFVEIRKNETAKQLSNSILTPFRYGYIDLKEEKINERMQRDSISKTLKDIMPKEPTQTFAFIDFILNTEFEDIAGRISFSSIMTRIRDEYKLIERKFEELTGGLEDKNHCCLEYQFFSDGYTVTEPDKNVNHLLLFSAVDRKETVESKLLSFPNLNPNPGQVLTMVTQMAETLHTLIFNTSIFGNEDNTVAPLIPRIPGLLLGDIWIFGKWYYKLNWIFAFDYKDHPFLSQKIKDTVHKAIRNQDGKSNAPLMSLKDLYYYNIHSLGALAMRYLRPGYKNSGSEKDDIKELKKYLDSSFMNEFKEEGELLGKLIEFMMELPEKHAEYKGEFHVREWIANNREYQNRNPIKFLLRELLEENGSIRKRLEEIRAKILNQNVPRGLELKLLSELILKNKLTAYENKLAFVSTVNDTESEDGKPAPPPQKGPNPPFLEIQYPLDVRDYCNISPNANSEKLICQVQPLFEKDFYVYKAFTSQLVLSIEFSDDLTILLSSLAQTTGYVSAELDQERRVVFRSALNLQAFENELESHITALDTLALIAVIVLRKLNFCIEYEEFGRIGRNSKLILDEIDFHLQSYRNRALQLTHNLQF